MTWFFPCLVSTSLLLALPASAQTWPTKPIKILVGYSAGGAVDTTARIVAERLSGALGQSVLVENRPGATGNIAAEQASHAAPDGYTLFMSTSITTVSLSLSKNLPYHPLKSFEPISRAVYATNVLAVHPSVQAKNVKELAALAKASPGKLLYATSGPGSSPHLSAELFSTLAGIEMVHVPYKGGAPAVADLIGGHVSLSFSNPTSVIPHFSTGKLRGLAVTGVKRFPGLPDLPTMIEEGYPDFDLSAWYGLVAPAGTPAPIVDRLNAEVVKILSDPKVGKLFLEQGLDAAPSTRAEMGAEIERDIDKYAKLLKAAGIEAQ